MAEPSAWDQLTGSLTEGISTVFSEGLPKYVDAEIERPYKVNQPTRQYEVAPNGVAQRAGIVPSSSFDSPWLIGGLVIAGVVAFMAVNK